MENKKMTADKLARMTQDQFSEIDKRFDAVDVRFDKIDERFDKVDNTLFELKEGQKRLLEIALDIPSKKTFGRLEDKVQTMDARLASVERKIK